MYRPGATWPLRPGCTVDLDRQVVRRDGEIVDLTSREAEVLRYLVEREGTDVSVEALHREVWGHGRDVVSRAAQNTLHRLKRKIERDPARPEHLLNVHGVGVRLVRAAEVQAVPVSSADSELFGRGRDLATLRALLGAHRAVTLSGIGGIGKTRLARAVLRERGGVFVDLVGATDADGVLRATAGALGLTLGGDGVVQVGRALTAAGPMLVVLDNAEHVADHVRDLLGRWLDTAPAATWLVTSRVRLGAYGERLHALDPLEVPAADFGEDEVLASPAVQLFLARATGAPGDPRDVAVLVRRLEGIPLALELAAARTSVLDAAGIVARLDDTLRMLRRPGKGRQDAVAQTLTWSWSLLDPAARAALAQCSAFRTPFRIEAAEAVVAVPEDVFLLDVLHALVDASLLHRVAGEPARLSMYTVVRDFAATHLDDATVGIRHARFFALHGAPSSDLSDRGADAAAGMRRRDAELEDLIAAADVALGARDAATVLDLARALTSSLLVRGPLLGARPWVEAALALAEGEPHLADRRGAVRVHWGSALARAGRWPEVDALLEAGGADRPSTACRTQLHFLATLRDLMAGRLDAADASWRAAMDGVGADDGLHAQLLNLGAHLAVRRGEPQEARAMLERGLALAVGRDTIRRGLHSTLGVVLTALGRRREGHEQRVVAVALAREGADLHALADALEGLGTSLIEIGEPETAEQAYAEASAVFARLGQARPTLLANRAELALDRGDPHAARLLAGEATRQAREGGAALVEALSLAVEGRALLASGDVALGLAVLDEAHARLPGTEVRARAQLDLSRAIAAARLGRDESRVVLDGAREALGGAPADRLHGWCALGEVEAALGDPEAARRALAEARALQATCEAPRLDRLVRDLERRCGGGGR